MASADNSSRFVAVRDLVFRDGSRPKYVARAEFDLANVGAVDADTTITFATLPSGYVYSVHSVRVLSAVATVNNNVSLSLQSLDPPATLGAEVSAGSFTERDPGALVRWPAAKGYAIATASDHVVSLSLVVAPESDGTLTTGKFEFLLDAYPHLYDAKNQSAASLTKIE